MLDTLKLSERTVVHARHYAALPELVTTTDLLAIVPQSYARSMASRWPVCVRALPGDAPQYDVQMVWHATAEREPAHLWLRALVRRLFARGAVRRDRGGDPGVVPGNASAERLAGRRHLR
jgi:DNA-binding transcriptional LysR family regulator